MEQDSDAGGYTTLFRPYDEILGRWRSVDPKWDMQPSISTYAFSNNTPIYGNDPRGDICVPCLTAAAGALVGGGAAVYDLYRAGRIDDLMNGGAGAWAYVGTGALAGGLVGSGVGGLAGAVGISAGGNVAQQLIINDRLEVDIVQTALAGAMGLGGYQLGKVLSGVLKPVRLGTAGTIPITDAWSLPSNSVGANTGAAFGSAITPSIAEKLSAPVLPELRISLEGQEEVVVSPEEVTSTFSYRASFENNTYSITKIETFSNGDSKELTQEIYKENWDPDVLKQVKQRIERINNGEVTPE
jgi:RHS repeat-associated protein